MDITIKRFSCFTELIFEDINVSVATGFMDDDEVRCWVDKFQTLADDLKTNLPEEENDRI